MGTKKFKKGLDGGTSSPKTVVKVFGGSSVLVDNLSGRAKGKSVFLEEQCIVGKVTADTNASTYDAIMDLQALADAQSRRKGLIVAALKKRFARYTSIAQNSPTEQFYGLVLGAKDGGVHIELYNPRTDNFETKVFPEEALATLAKKRAYVRMDYLLSEGKICYHFYASTKAEYDRATHKAADTNYNIEDTFLYKSLPKE